MALCEDESCGLARVTSDDGIVRGRGACGKGFELAEPAPPGVPSASGEHNDSSGHGKGGKGSVASRVSFSDDGGGFKLRVLRHAADGRRYGVVLDHGHRRV